MAHPLGTDLVISDPSEDIAVTHRNKEEQLVCTYVARMRERAFFRDEAVQLELADFNVKPGALEKIIEPDVHRFKVKRTSLIGRWNEQEREVLLQRPASQNVQATQIKSGGSHPLLPCRSGI